MTMGFILTEILQKCGKYIVHTHEALDVPAFIPRSLNLALHFSGVPETQG